MPRPLLHPALVRVWRDRSTIQFGLSDTHAVVIGGLPATIAELVEQLDGFHTTAGLCEVARARGIDTASFASALSVLESHGVVVDADESGLPGPDPLSTWGHDSLGRVPDRLSVALVDGRTDAGRAAMATRAASQVEVIGGGRIGASVARLLAAAGIGLVRCDDDAPVRADDVTPGGLDRSAVGDRRDHAVTEALARDAGDLADPPAPGKVRDTLDNAGPAGIRDTVNDTGPGGVRDAMDDARPAGVRVVVIAADTGTGRTEAARQVAAGAPHLVARIDEVTGVVGPLVVPGRTACLRCVDQHRTDRDPEWPTVLRRAEVVGGPAIPARDAALAAVVAGLAAAQVLGFIDGHDVAAMNGTIETTLPEALPRRRSWPPHPACGCSWRQGR